MSATPLERAREAFNRIDVSDTQRADDYVYLLATVGALLNALEAKEEPACTPAAMTRPGALAAAREHIEAMSTNVRGYQDGVKLPEKVAAVERFARFLMGEADGLT
ncbi:hypothetical protein [Streptomyces avermitilis]|uniref:hypothetical protein n=1 Tax=Streptomyces avermitilis TaxID=33903 RepID=UPI00380AA752